MTGDVITPRRLKIGLPFLLAALATLLAITAVCRRTGEYQAAASVVRGPQGREAAAAKTLPPAASSDSNPRSPAWQAAKAAVDKTILKSLNQRRAELRKSLAQHRFAEGNTRRRRIALTIDDGPHPGYTERILAILKQNNVKATFFLVGKMAEQRPDLVRAEVAAGHELANHTYHHPDLTRSPDRLVAIELKACEEVVRKITGRTMNLFRPPGGRFDPRVSEITAGLGYTTVLWTNDPADFLEPGVRVIRARCLRGTGPGGILLLHDGYGQTLEALPQVIQDLKARGYEFVTISELMGKKRG
jgi:peptidoglycan-N-acetylglucosamine deacetylase